MGFFFFLLSVLILARIKVLGKSLVFFPVLLPACVCFLVREVLVFFIVFERVVFPMGLFICMGKTGERRAGAWFFFLYTLLLSIPFFLGLLFITSGGEVTRFSLWGGIPSSWMSRALLMIMIVKFPVFLLHRWLPRAHVEAPTIGSVLLARVLLKLGSYGVLRLITQQLVLFSELTVVLGVFGALVASVICFLQTDFKALIAMSSVAHMSALWRAVALTRGGAIDSNVSLSVSHGFVAARLFFFVGYIYDCRGSRSLLLLRDRSSLASLPVFLWVVVCFSNSGLPPLLRFFGEIFVIQRLAVASFPLIILFFFYGAVCGLFSFSIFDWSVSEKKSLLGGGTVFPVNETIFGLVVWNLGILFLFWGTSSWFWKPTNH